MNTELDRVYMARDAAQLLRFKRGWSSKLLTEGILARTGCGTVLVAAASLKAYELVTNRSLGVLHESQYCIATRTMLRHESLGRQRPPLASRQTLIPTRPTIQIVLATAQLRHVHPRISMIASKPHQRLGKSRETSDTVEIASNALNQEMRASFSSGRFGCG